LLLPAASTDALSVDALVRSALGQNPEAAFYEARIAAAKSERADAGRRPNPQLNAQLGSWSVRGTGDGPMWQAAMSQTFEWPGRLNLRKAIADGQTEMAELGLAAFRNALAAKVRSAAVGMMMEQEKATAAAAASARIAAVVAVLVQRDPTGPAPLLETRILEASLITLSRDAALSRKEVAAVMTDLNLLRGARPETEFSISPGGLELPAVPELETLLKAARLSNFDLRMRQMELRQQGFAVNLARNERGPDISVQPFVNSQNAGKQRETIAGLSVNVPLPLWNDGKARVSAEEARLQQARVSMEVALREVESRIVTKRREYAALAAELGNWRDDSLAKLEEAAQQADRHYQLGAIPVATYIELQKSYLEALGALLDTRAEALAALLDLELLSGLTLRPSAR
jgi:cobalt-zinc-cadmium efflux system outer membrane protein